MQKKIYSILCAVLLLLTTVNGAYAAEQSYDFIKNGSFETTGASGVPNNWTLSGTAGVNFELSKDAKTGENAVRMFSESENVFLVSRFSGLVGGKTYTLRAGLKPVKLNGAGAYVKIEFRDNDGNDIGNYTKEYKSLSSSWTELEESVLVPQGASQASLLIRLIGGGDLYWDDVSFVGARAEIVPVEAPTEKAEGGEFVKNGSFEEVDDKNQPISWAFSATEEKYEIVSDAKDGAKALYMKSNGGNITAVSRFDKVLGEETYTFGAYINVKSYSSSGPFLQINFYDATGTAAGPAQNLSLADDTGEWTYKLLSVKTPAKTVSVSMLIRLLGAGEMYWDAVSFIGKGGTVTPPEPVKLAENPDGKVLAVDGTEVLTDHPSILTNGDFEDADATGKVSGWNTFPAGGKDAQGNERPVYWGAKNAQGIPGYIDWETETVAKGNRAIRIYNTDGIYSPYLSQTVQVTPETDYQLYAQYNSGMEGFTNGSLAFKIEFYKDALTDAGYIQGASTQRVSGTDNTWQYLAHNFTTPTGCNLVTILVRLWQCGDVIYDNVGLVHKGNANMLSVKSSETFIYPDSRGDFTITASPNVAAFPTLTSAKVDIVMSKGGTTLGEHRDLAIVGDTVTATFNYNLVTELKTPYTITAYLKDAAGEILQTEECFVYKFARPNYLDDYGLYIGDGTPMQIMSGYRYLPEHVEKAYPAGFNVAQVPVSSTFEGEESIKYVRNQLDAFRNTGVKAFVCLYRKSYPAGHPDNIDNTRLIVETFKNDPAVFAWAIADEIFTHMTNPYNALRDSYVAIRTIDDNHPVLINEATDTYQRDAGKYADILSVDPYPANHDDPTYFPSLRVAMAREAVDYQKPVISILQGIDYMNYWPTGDDTRSMMYQSFFAGAIGVGFYQFTTAKTDANGKDVPLTETDIWPYIDAFGRLEKDVMFQGFVQRTLPEFSEVRNDTAWYASFVKDGSIYFAVLNRQKTDITIDILLTSFDGRLAVGNFSGEVINGVAAESFSGNGSFTAKVNGGGATMYKITPTDSVDFSALTTTHFNDLGYHAWARAAITDMEKAGVVTGETKTAFRPGKAITRGDFAMFLVKALGLTTAPAENFADVDANAPYAQAIAIGRAAGVLNGVGNNLYLPEAEITRQDLMAICARGMRLQKALPEDGDVSAFPDAGLIASYAAADIAAIVRANIIKGNADGTINPLGNTTRAEAAVIMSRIINWKVAP